jgi:hypothetical protein
VHPVLVLVPESFFFPAGGKNCSFGAVKQYTGSPNTFICKLNICVNFSLNMPVEKVNLFFDSWNENDILDAA